MFRTLEALKSNLPVQSSSYLVTGRQSSSLDLARVNRRIADELCLAMLRSLPSHHFSLTSPRLSLSPTELLAYKARSLQCSVYSAAD